MPGAVRRSVRAVGGDEAGFAGDEGERGVARDDGVEMAAGVGIQPARTIEREQGAAIAPGERVGGADQLGTPACRRAQADAEQRVDDQAPARCLGDRRRMSPPASMKRWCAAAASAGCFAASPENTRRTSQKARRRWRPAFKAIAAVVAGAGEDQHRRLPVAQQPARQLGCRQPGALHQQLRAAAVS